MKNIRARSMSERLAVVAPARSRRVGEGVPRVLLVDDEPLVLRSTSRILSDGWRIHTATNASAAVSMLRVQAYDAVLSDFDMPGENGLWLLERIRDISPRTRRILVSGSAPELFGEHLKSGLIHDFLPKPLNPSLLPLIYSM